MVASDSVFDDSVVRLANSFVSLSLGLERWQINKMVGAKEANDFTELTKSLLSSIHMRAYTYLKTLSRDELIWLMQNLIPRRRRRQIIKQFKRQTKRSISRAIPFFEEFQDALVSGIQQVAENSTGNEKVADKLYPELSCDVNALTNEPWRAAKAFPIEILKSPREQARLKDELGLSDKPDNYARQMVSIIWQMGANPYSIGLDPPRRNDLIYKLAGLQPSEDVTGRQFGTALAHFLEALTDENSAKTIIDHGIARSLRHLFGLSQDRNVRTFTDIENEVKTRQKQASNEPNDEPWEPEDTLSLRGYDEVDNRMECEALRNQLPHKQQEAFDIYRKSFETGETVEEICARQGLEPVVVRNNFQAIKKKGSTGKLKT